MSLPTRTRLTVLGLFVSEEDASRALQGMLDLGCSREGISALLRSNEARRRLLLRDDTESVEGAATGAALGVPLGALAFGALSLSGVGVLAAGPLAAALAGAGGTGLAGTVLGYLVGLGVPDEDADLFARHLEDGRIVVGAEIDEEQADAARKVMASNDAERISIARVSRETESEEGDRT